MLPKGFRVRISDEVRLLEGGGVLVGGTPTRVIRLKGAAREAVAAGGREVLVRCPVTQALARALLDADLAVPVLPTRDVGAADALRLTVVVPVRDRACELDRLLGALGGELPVVVVDDASLEPTRVAAVAAAHCAHLVRLPTNLGPAGARNAGLREVATDLVAFVDSDVCVRASDLLALVPHFDDPALAMVAPRVRSAPAGTLPAAMEAAAKGDSTPGGGASARQGRVERAPGRWFERYDAACSSLDMGPRSGAVRAGGRVGWLPSACVLGRTGMLRAAGGFAESMRVGEDVDLVWRLVGSGARVRYDADVHAWHESRDSAGAWLRRQLDYGTSAALLAERHGDLVAPAVLGPATAAATAAVLVAPAPIGVLAIGALAARQARVLAERTGDRGSASSLSAKATRSILQQGSSLVLRHWLPAVALGGLVSGRARRALAVAALIDLAGTEPAARRATGAATHALARRLDDAAYGTGVWLGALRARSPRALLPRRAG